MTELIERLQSRMEGDAAGSPLLGDAVREITALREKRDALEEILIVLVRTGIPWDADGVTTDAFPHFRERYRNAMHQASELLGLELRSTITRTEPRS